MTFKHITQKFEKFDLPVSETEAGRFYQTPYKSWFPSVTTFLGSLDKTWITDWIDRVGEEEAKRVSSRALKYGSAVHNCLEKYIKNDPEYKKGFNSIVLEYVRNIKHILDENIGVVGFQEFPLWSDTLQLAGRIDLFGQWKGSSAIIDFKTSNYEKTREQIRSYILQETAYAQMVRERYKLRVDKLITIITVSNGLPQVFEEDASKYLDELKSLRFKKVVDISS